MLNTFAPIIVVLMLAIAGYGLFDTCRLYVRLDRYRRTGIMHPTLKGWIVEK